MGQPLKYNYQILGRPKIFNLIRSGIILSAALDQPGTAAQGNARFVAGDNSVL